MCEPTEPFSFPELPDEALIAIENFLEEFYTRFENHYFGQLHRYYHERPEGHPELDQMRLPLPDPPF